MCPLCRYCAAFRGLFRALLYRQRGGAVCCINDVNAWGANYIAQTSCQDIGRNELSKDGNRIEQEDNDRADAQSML